MSTRAKWVLAAGVILALTFAAYRPALSAGFVWDDNILLTNNEMIKAQDGLYRFWFTADAWDYFPVTWTSLWLEWRLWGEDPTGYHVVSILQHALGAILLYAVLRKLHIPGAYLAAVIFAVHPVTVMSVAWISERKNTLSLIFYLLTFLCYLRFDEDRRWPWYALSLGMFLLALLSKTSVVMLPVVLLLLVWWRHGRIRLADGLATVPFFILTAGMSAVTIWFQTVRSIGEAAVRPEGLFSRLAAAGWVPWFYLSKLLLPVDLLLIYPRWQVDQTSVVSYLPGIAFLACLAVFWMCRHSWGRPMFFGFSYFVVMLFPVLGFFQMAFAEFSLVSDHLQYLPMIGIVALVVGLGWWAFQRFGWPVRAAGVLLAAGIVIALSLATSKHCNMFKDRDTMWRTQMRKRPDSPTAYYNLGLTLEKSGRLYQASAYYEKAIALKPRYSQAHNNLARICDRLGQREKALYHFRQAVKHKPDNLNARFNLAMRLSEEGQYVEAIAAFYELLDRKPDWSIPLTFFAKLLATVPDARLRNGPEALRLATRAVEKTEDVSPRPVEPLVALAAAYAETGDFSSAVETATRALELAEQQRRRTLYREIHRQITEYHAGHPLRLIPYAPATQSTQPQGETPPGSMPTSGPAISAPALIPGALNSCARRYNSATVHSGENNPLRHCCSIRWRIYFVRLV